MSRMGLSAAKAWSAASKASKARRDKWECFMAGTGTSVDGGPAERYTAREDRRHPARGLALRLAAKHLIPSSRNSRNPVHSNPEAGAAEGKTLAPVEMDSPPQSEDNPPAGVPVPD